MKVSDVSSSRCLRVLGCGRTCESFPPVSLSYFCTNSSVPQTPGVVDPCVGSWTGNRTKTTHSSCRGQGSLLRPTGTRSGSWKRVLTTHIDWGCPSVLLSVFGGTVKTCKGQDISNNS